MTDRQEAGFSWGWQEFVYSPSGAKVAVLNGQTLDHAYVALPGGAQAIFNASGLSQYRQADWLGSARLGANTTGAAVEATAYAPYGENYSTWGGGLTFTGKDEDTVWNGTAALYREGDRSAGINRHIVGDERAPQERRSDSILTPSLAGMAARSCPKRRQGHWWAGY